MTEVIRTQTKVVVAPSGVSGAQGPPGPAGSGSTIGVKDEGSTVSLAVERVNFTGSGVSVSGGGADVTVNIQGMVIGLFTAAASLTIPSGTDVVRTAGYHTTGKGVADYFYDAAVDSTYVSAHPRTSFVSANGRGFRLVRGGYFTLEQFGAHGDYAGDNLTGSGTDDKPAFDAYQDYCKFLNENADTFNLGSPYLFFDSPAYYCSDTFDAKVTVKWLGTASGQAGGKGTRIIYAANKAGVRVHAYNTIGEMIEASPTKGADGSLFRGIIFESKGGTPSLLKSGIWMRAAASVEQCQFIGFPGYGTLVLADVTGGDTSQGNANGWKIDTVYILGCKTGGHLASGGDSNAGSGRLIFANFCAGYGIRDFSFLGNHYEHCQTQQCGVNGAGGLSQTSFVSDGSYRYRLIDGQDALAASTAPTSGGNNAVWQFVGAGGTHSLIPLYSTYVAGGGSFVSGGGYYFRGTNCRSVATHCYNEGDSAPPIVLPPSMAVGGFMSPSDAGTTYMYGGGDLGIVSSTGFGKEWADPATGAIIRSFVGGGANTKFLQAWYHSVDASNYWRISFSGAPFTGDLVLKYQDTFVPWYITGPNTIAAFGTGTAQPYTFNPRKFALGDDSGGRIMTYDSAAPTSGAHAAGEIVFNNAPTAGGKVGWVCTTAGTPGTWKPWGAIDA